MVLQRIRCQKYKDLVCLCLCPCSTRNVSIAITDSDIYQAQVIITIVSCWLASGIVFGFAALKPVLVDQGVYRELCSAEELKLDVEVCYEQDLR